MGRTAVPERFGMAAPLMGCKCMGLEDCRELVRAILDEEEVSERNRWRKGILRIDNKEALLGRIYNEALGKWKMREIYFRKKGQVFK